MQYTEGSAPIDGKLMSLYENGTGNRLKVSYNGISAANPVTSGSFDVEYDMKLNYVTTGSGSTQMGQSPAVKFSNTGSSHLFDSSSKKINVGGAYYADMYGEGKVYVESNKWIHVKYTYDVDNKTMKCVVTKDGTDYTFGPVTNDAFGRISDLYLYWTPWSAEGTWKGISLDNMRVGIPQSVGITSASYTAGGKTYTAADTISKDTDSIALTLGAELKDVSNTKISIKVNGGDAIAPKSAASRADNSKIVDIALPDSLSLNEGDKVEIIFASSLKLADSSTLGKELSVRYEVFDHVYGNILEDILYNPLYQTHPKIFVTPDRIAEIKTNINNDAGIKRMYDELIYMCNTYLSKALTAEPQGEGMEGRVYAALAATAAPMIKDLGFAYQLTGNESYAQRAWSEIDNVLNWSSWKLDLQYLDASTAVPGILAGFDMIYNSDYMKNNPANYNSFVTRFREKYFDFAVGVYDGTNKANGSYNEDNFSSGSNWNAVCGSGMLYAALALVDMDSADSELTQKCIYLAEKALTTLNGYPAQEMNPSGSSVEGVIYTEYYLTSLCGASKVLRTVCGTDYGLFNLPGLDRSPEYFFNVNTRNGIYAYSETEPRAPYFPASLYSWAYLNGDDSFTMELNRYREYLGLDFTYDLLSYINTTASSNGISYPLDYYNERMQSITLRSSWSDNDTMYLSTIGGENDTILTHYDKGSFIYETSGIRWFDDLGRDNYDIEDGYWDVSTRKKLYRLRTEGHNNVVVDPSTSKYSADSSFGQIDGEATIERHDFSSKGAIAVYDLSGVYDSSDVSAYKRGIRTSDDRKSAIIQDEITVKSGTFGSGKDVYWFAHSQKDMEVAGDNTVVLTSGNKKLKVEFYSNKAFTLEIKDTTPLNAKTVVDDEYSRDGWNKISLKISGATGDVVITAKMTPIDGNTYSPLEYQAIDSWSNASGKYINPYVMTDGVNAYKVAYNTSKTTELICDAPSSTGADFYIDNNLVKSFADTGNDGVYSVGYDASDLNIGEHEFKVIATYADGSTEEKAVNITVTKKLEKNISDTITASMQDFNNLPDFTSGSNAYMISADANTKLADSNIPWEITGTNIYVERAMGKSGIQGDYALCVRPTASTSDSSKMTLKGIPEGGYTSGRLTIEFDWKASFNSNANGFNPRMTGLPISAGGDIKAAPTYVGLYGSSLVPKSDSWIHMRYEYDIDNDIIIITAEDTDGNKMTKSQKAYQETNVFKTFNLLPWFWSAQGTYLNNYKAVFTIDNFRMSLWDSTETDIVVYSDEAKANADVYFAAYKANELVSLKIVTMDLAVGANRLDFADLDVSDCDEVKVFTFGDAIKPLSSAIEYKNIK